MAGRGEMEYDPRIAARTLQSGLNDRADQVGQIVVGIKDAFPIVEAQWIPLEKTLRDFTKGTIPGQDQIFDFTQEGENISQKLHQFRQRVEKLTGALENIASGASKLRGATVSGRLINTLQETLQEWPNPPAIVHIVNAELLRVSSGESNEGDQLALDLITALNTAKNTLAQMENTTAN